MTKLSRSLWGLAAGGLLAAAFGLSRGQSEAPPNPAPPAGRSVATLTRYTMKLANGLSVPVYPKDALHPYDSADWLVGAAFTVTAFRFDPIRQELQVTVDYGWRKSDEDVLRPQLVAKYREAGKAISPDAITFTPLALSAHSLLLRDMDRDYVLYSTDKESNLSSQTVAFKIPIMAEGANRLHERLSTIPEAIQIVLRGGVRFDRLSALTIERRGLSTAFQKVFESIKPLTASKADSLLVDRDAVQELRRRLAAEVVTQIKSYGLSAAEESEALKTALSHIERLELPSAPLSVRELLDLEGKSFMLTAEGVQKEGEPAITSNQINNLKEVESYSEKVVQVAEAISDIASNSDYSDSKFHSLARSLMLKAEASGSFVVFSAGAKMHLDQSEADINESRLRDIKQARTYAMNKTNYLRDVQMYRSKEVFGVLNSNASTAKLLQLRRLSAADLAATATQGWSVVRITGDDVLFTDTPVSLRATPIPPEHDFVAALTRRLRDLEKRVEQIPTTLRIQGLHVALKDIKNATRNDNIYTFPYYDKPFGSPHLDEFATANYLPVYDREGRPVEFDEVLAVDVVAKSQYRGMLFYWSIGTRTVRRPSGKFGIDLLGLGFNDPAVHHYGNNPPSNVMVDLIVTAR